jgi:hypothetical protein
MTKYCTFSVILFQNFQEFLGIFQTFSGTRDRLVLLARFYASGGRHCKHPLLVSRDYRGAAWSREEWRRVEWSIEE